MFHLFQNSIDFHFYLMLNCINILRRFFIRQNTATWIWNDYIFNIPYIDWFVRGRVGTNDGERSITSRNHDDTFEIPVVSLIDIFISCLYCYGLLSPSLVLALFFVVCPSVSLTSLIANLRQYEWWDVAHRRKPHSCGTCSIFKSKSQSQAPSRSFWFRLKLKYACFVVFCIFNRANTRSVTWIENLVNRHRSLSIFDDSCISIVRLLWDGRRPLRVTSNVMRPLPLGWQWVVQNPYPANIVVWAAMILPRAVVTSSTLDIMRSEMNWHGYHPSTFTDGGTIPPGDDHFHRGNWCTIAESEKDTTRRRRKKSKSPYVMRPDRPRDYNFHFKIWSNIISARWDNEFNSFWGTQVLDTVNETIPIQQTNHTGKDHPHVQRRVEGSTWDVPEVPHDYAVIYASLPVQRVTLLRDPWSWLISKCFWHHRHTERLADGRTLLRCDNIEEGSRPYPNAGWIAGDVMHCIAMICGFDCGIRFERNEITLVELRVQSERNLRHTFSVVGLLNETETFYDMVSNRIAYVDMSLNPRVKGKKHHSFSYRESQRCKRVFMENTTFQDELKNAYRPWQFWNICMRSG